MPEEALDTPSRDWGWVSLAVGGLAFAWAILVLLPEVDGLPAWPAASLGVAGLALALLPGRALARGLGTFLAVVAILVGGAKILALWGLLEIMS